MFDKALQFIYKYEGGYTNDPRDPGNWTGGAVGKGTLKGTNRGISASAYPNLDIRNLTDKQIENIYYNDYWLASGAHRLPPGLALFVFDIAVNMGVSRARNWLVATGSLRGLARLQRLMVLRCDFYAQLDHIDHLYGKGWYTRAVDCYTNALMMDLWQDMVGKRLFVDNLPVRHIEAISLVGDKLYIRRRP